MVWKKLTETKDFISYEKTNKKLMIRIEARLEQGLWKIYKTYYDDKNLRFVQEFTLTNNKKLSYFVNNLKNEKDLPKQKIEQMAKQQEGSIKIQLKRIHKEYEFEKWKFSINDELMDNSTIIHFGESLDIDLIINQKYMHLKKPIIANINSILGITDFEKTIHTYFYNYESEENERNKKSGMVIGKIELDAGMKDDED